MFSSQAANYLDIKGLLDVTCKTVANNIKGKTLGEIQRMFNINSDCTSQEQKASTTAAAAAATTTPMQTRSAASRKRKLAASTSSTPAKTVAMGVLSCSRTFNEFPDGDLYSIFECMLAVTNDLAVLYALAQV